MELHKAKSLGVDPMLETNVFKKTIECLDFQFALDNQVINNCKEDEHHEKP